MPAVPHNNKLVLAHNRRLLPVFVKAIGSPDRFFVASESLCRVGTQDLQSKLTRWQALLHTCLYSFALDSEW